jgi:hypothetical protein
MQPTHLEITPQLWPTASALDWKSGKSNQHGKNSRPLNEVVCGPAKMNGSLNPAWVEWLMGYPTGWTALNASETQSFRKSRSKSSKK